ncbi:MULTISPECIES: MFS transporter [unclassified Rhizobium]|uniref:MFS transporter n=1 Tax=unclassified Rhizobium TaxID=2613769 RepID=UPI0006F62D1D|nr:MULTISPECIES: MFS transporter [unclassified Rhizobium]KQV33614.1 MFS transporter [Rhizobium sp. Root1212]KRD23158.1 MFS transporter [Rhizobium sp. Root268]
MTRFIPDVFRDPTIRVSMFAIFAFGFAGAATSPYQSVVGIRELGLSDIVYSALIFLAAGVNVVVSVLLGNVADRIGNYRTMLLIVPFFGIVGYGAVYIFPAQATFVVAILLFLPIYGALNSLLFANVRAVTRGMPRDDIANVNSGVRAMISLSWVLVPGITGALLARSASMLPAYLFASLACVACLALIAAYLPRQTKADAPAAPHLSHLAALGAVVSPKVFVRVLAVALITSTLHVNAAVLPLITTGAANGAVSDIGVLVGIVALLEVIFIVFWGWLQKSMPPIAALAAGTILYVIYLLLLGFASAPWHLYALTVISGLGAAALISIPITYLQDLIADRPGLGSSLISINIFVSAGLSALLFALGTAVSSYSGTAIIGAVAGLTGIGMLLFFDGRRGR